jgi:N-formylglutamate deformylase
VHVLWESLPTVGATLLVAEFPRCYIDPNREVDDIDPDMLAGRWPGSVQPSEKTRLGIGLFWRVAGHTTVQPIYTRKLTVTEAQNRIARYYRPYHAALQASLDAARQHFGTVWHLNLHSMPTHAEACLQKPHRGLADVVLGDRDGSSCDPGFTAEVAQAFRSRGLRVALNDPFKGLALIARVGRPAEHRHSLQIELHRGLYMHEATRKRSAGFLPLQQALAGVAADLCAYVRDQTQPTPTPRGAAITTQTAASSKWLRAT